MTMIRSLEEHGQLQPIGLTPEYKLVFGERRLRAAQEIGWQYIEAIVKDRPEELLEELAENTDRKPFDPLELVNIGRKIESGYEAEAKERMSEGGQGGVKGTILGKTIDLVAKQLGTSGTTYIKAKAVVEAAEADPDRFEHLISEMQRTKKVNAAFNKLKKTADEDRVLGLKPVEGKFRTLIFDCPWDFPWLSESARATPGYATMSLDEIEDINPRQWAMDDFCHLYMWAPNNFVAEACRIMEAWGFDHRTVITWRKPKIGERMSEGGKGVVNNPTLKGKTCDQVAKHLGTSGTT
jgi:hypothetical protein